MSALEFHDVTKLRVSTVKRTRSPGAAGVLLLTSLLAGAFCHDAAGQSLMPRPPNVLLIVSDDQGYGDLGCYGSLEAQTPALDALVAEGVRLTNFYVAWPACTPSRASLLTGRYPQRHGLYDMIRNEGPDYGKRYSPEEYAVSFERIAGLDVREQLISEALQAKGYRCGMIGKWDLGMQRRFLPPSRGFDVFYGFVNTGVDYFTHERYGVPSMYRGYEPTQADRGAYSTWVFEREAANFLREHADAPFFLYLAYNAPHTAASLDPAVRGAAQAPQELQSLPPDETVGAPTRRSRRLRHLEAIAAMDQSIGRLMQLLQDLALEDRTIVIFMSDNGAGPNGDNGPLRGYKGDLWEGGLRVPCIVRYPGTIPPGSTNDAFLTALDVAPTLLAAAGAEPAPDLVLDGADMMPVLTGEAMAIRTEMFWQRRNLKAARVGPWKWVETPDGGGLFDLSVDSGEERDLTAEAPQRATELAERFARWRQEMDETPPRDPFRDY